MQINELVGKYVELRDKKAEFKKEYELKVSKLDEVLDKIEVTLLKTFQESGVDSLSTPSETAYVTSRTSATVADWDQFSKFVIEGGNFDFLEKRCSKEAVIQYKAAHNDLPPGINLSESRSVNIRRK